MAALAPEILHEQLELAEQLWSGRETMLEPADLPGRFGRVIHALERVVAAVGCEAVVAGGWALWRHGYLGRVTRDVDLALPAASIDDFLRVAAVTGFQPLDVPEGRWPKVLHTETHVEVDVLPESGRPGMADRPAPTTIPSPARLGGVRGAIRYISLAGLVELKLAAGRSRDLADIVELLRVNPEETANLRAHAAAVHPDYAAAFDRLTDEARRQVDH
ncbi:MAG: hypothetical protein KY476_23810 [Planctomycetes bacterium]|nr:hypothetical protein [Planctomycetota bacterium]